MHAVCLWDDKGPAKIHQALKEDILDFIKQAQAVSSVCMSVFVFVLFLKTFWRSKHLTHMTDQLFPIQQKLLLR